MKKLSHDIKQVHHVPFFHCFHMHECPCWGHLKVVTWHMCNTRKKKGINYELLETQCRFITLRKKGRILLLRQRKHYLGKFRRSFQGAFPPTGRSVQKEARPQWTYCASQHALLYMLYTILQKSLLAFPSLIFHYIAIIWESAEFLLDPLVWSR